MKAMGLVSKTTILHMLHAFRSSVNFFTLPAQLHREMTKF